VAVKVVKKDARLDSSASQRLLQEARASSALAHPNICTIYEVGETDGELYIVMELGGRQVSARQESADAGLPPESVLRHGVQIASALGRVNQRIRLVHFASIFQPGRTD
jgi:eukaryotic-like serine/threonine-protein kinase